MSANIIYDVEGVISDGRVDAVGVNTLRRVQGELARLQAIEAAAIRWQSEYFRNGERDADSWGIVAALAGDGV